MAFQGLHPLFTDVYVVALKIPTTGQKLIFRDSSNPLSKTRMNANVSSFNF